MTVAAGAGRPRLSPLEPGSSEAREPTMGTAHARRRAVRGVGASCRQSRVTLPRDSRGVYRKARGRVVEARARTLRGLQFAEKLQSRVGQRWAPDGNSESHFRQRPVDQPLPTWPGRLVISSGSSRRLPRPERGAVASRMGPRLRLLAFLSMLALASCPNELVLARTRSPRNLQVTSQLWGPRDGAPGAIADLAQTADGFLWIAASTGLYQFDGMNFERFRPPRGQKLLSLNIYSVFAPRSGGLWVGYTFGGFSFIHGTVTNYGGKIASATGSVFQFAAGGDGVIWAGTNSGMWRFDHSRWQHLGAAWNLSTRRVVHLGFDVHGVLWAFVGTRHSADLIYLLPHATRFEFAARNIHFKGFTTDASGRIVTTPRRYLGARSGPPEYPVIAKYGNQGALIDRTGSIWINTIHDHPGVYRVPASSKSVVQVLDNPIPRDAKHYPPQEFAADKLVDREGNVWFADSRGLWGFFYGPLIRQPLPVKLSGGYALAAAGNSIWIASEPTQRLMHIVHGAVDSVLRLDGQGINFAYAAPDGTDWIATERTLWHLVAGHLVRVAIPPRLARYALHLQSITEGPRGGMWISFGRNGLYRLDHGVWSADGGDEGLPKNDVVIEFTDHLGRVWFGCTGNRLAVLNGDHVRLFTGAQGLNVGDITALYGRGAKIWIGGDLGLQQYDDGRFRSLSAVNEDWLSGISGIVETPNRDLWIYGASGIFHIRRAQIAQAFREPGYLVHGQHLGLRQGVPGAPAELRPIPSAIEAGGRLWFAGSRGVVWLNPFVRDLRAVAPKITAESLSANGRSYPVRSVLRLPSHTSDVRFTYAAASLSNPGAIRIRYRLARVDKAWHTVDIAGPVTYRNLSPGLYHFSIQASNTDGAWSGDATTVQFRILPAFYQTRWFLALCILAGVALLYVVHLLRVRELARQFHIRSEARIAERNRIARELHDSLLQGFQGLMFRLQGVRNLLPHQPGVAADALDQALSRGDGTICEARDAVRDLRASARAVGDLSEALQALAKEFGAEEGSEMTYRVVVTGRRRALLPQVRAEVYQVAREALRNALTHSRGHHVEIELEYSDRSLIMRVRDDGIGMEQEFLEQGARSGHWGLQGMRERTVRLGGGFNLWSRPDAGTEVEIVVPAASAYEKADKPRQTM